MHRILVRIPLPAVGYILTLGGFAFLGLFVAALGFGSDEAAALGLAMVGSYSGAALCFTLRRRQIAVADPTDDIVLGLDPIRGNTDRSAADRYAMRYRGQGTTNAVAASPVAGERPGSRLTPAA